MSLHALWPNYNGLYPLGESCGDFFSKNVVRTIDVRVDESSVVCAKQATFDSSSGIGLVLANRLLVQEGTLAGVCLFPNFHIDSLQRWAELECGDGRGCIERDEFSGIPQWRWATDTGKLCGRPIPDREKGALRRVKATGLYFYHQTDPRGAALYVSNVPLNDQNYSTIGICCAV
jgi:hypothetical protein